MKPKNLCWLILVGIIIFFSTQGQASGQTPASSPGLVRTGAGTQGQALVSLDCQGAPLMEVLRGISQMAGVNIIWGPELENRPINVKLDQVPWEEALRLILDSQGYAYTYEKKNRLLRIKAKEVPAVVKEPPETAVIPLAFAKADDLKKSEVLKKLVGEGSIESNIDTNSLTVTALKSQISEIKKVVTKLDVVPTQIMIEACVLETGSEYMREAGIDWDFSNFFLAGPVNGDWSVDGDWSSSNTDDTGGTMAIGYLGERQFLGTLNFLESKTDTHILSKPKIATKNNSPAEIYVGKTYRIPITVVSGGTTTQSTEKITAGVTLTVTPTINDNENISIQIHAKVSDVSAYDKNNYPIETESRADTTAMLKNGQTVVIAGLIKENKPFTASGIPVLRNIPILKWIFGKEKKGTEETRELVFFITPRIINNWQEVSAPTTTTK